MENAKRKIVYFWLTHIFLRRIGKRYPDYFVSWVKDSTDDITSRKIMSMRYLGDTQMKFEAIALTLNIPIRRVFEKHKKVIKRMVSGV